jgi:hypothetical protein
MESVWQEKYFNLDIDATPIPFNIKGYKESLEKSYRIGYYEELPILPSSKSAKRAIHIAK